MCLIHWMTTAASSSSIILTVINGGQVGQPVLDPLPIPLFFKTEKTVGKDIENVVLIYKTWKVFKEKFIKSNMPSSAFRTPGMGGGGFKYMGNSGSFESFQKSTIKYSDYVTYNSINITWHNK